MSELMNTRLPSVPWGLVDIVLGILIVGSGTVLLRFLMFDQAIKWGGSQALVTSTGIFLIEGLMVLAVLILAIGKYRSGWPSLGLRSKSAPGSYGLAIAVLMASLLSNTVYFVVISAAGWKDLQPPGIPSALVGEGVYRFFNAIAVGLWGPFAEEIFFRGFILTALIPKFGAVGAVVGSSLIFGVSHGSVAVALPIFVSGLLLAWLYLRTGSIWPCVAAHGAQNMLALVFAGYA